MTLNLNKVKGKGLKYNIEMKFYRKTKMEYLSTWITRNDVKTIDRKIQAIKI